MLVNENQNLRTNTNLPSGNECLRNNTAFYGSEEDNFNTQMNSTHIKTINSGYGRPQLRAYKYINMDLLSSDEPFVNKNNNALYDLEEDDAVGSVNSAFNHSHDLSQLRASKASFRESPSTEKDEGMVSNNKILSAVERTMRNYADSVTKVLETLGVRISQLESGSEVLNDSISALKRSAESYHNETGRSLRNMNERISEMQQSLQILRDKQYIIEVHAELEKIRRPSTKNISEKNNSLNPPLNGMTYPMDCQEQHQSIVDIASKDAVHAQNQMLVAAATAQQRVEQVQYFPADQQLQVYPQIVVRPQFQQKAQPPEQLQFQSKPNHMQAQQPIAMQLPNEIRPQHPIQHGPNVDNSRSFQQYTQSSGHKYHVSFPPSTLSYSEGVIANPSRHDAAILQPQRYGYHQAAVGPPHNSWNGDQRAESPSALPTAHAVHSEQLVSDMNGVVERVASMGFGRQQVINVINRLKADGQSTDVNVVLDILMNRNQI